MDSRQEGERGIKNGTDQVDRPSTGRIGGPLVELVGAHIKGTGVGARRATRESRGGGRSGVEGPSACAADGGGGGAVIALGEGASAHKEGGGNKKEVSTHGVCSKIKGS